MNDPNKTVLDDFISAVFRDGEGMCVLKIEDGSLVPVYKQKSEYMKTIKPIAFIGRLYDLKEYCIINRLNLNAFVKVCPTDHEPHERLRGIELSGLVVSDWAIGQTATKSLVELCLLRIKY